MTYKRTYKSARLSASLWCYRECAGCWRCRVVALWRRTNFHCRCRLTSTSSRHHHHCRWLMKLANMTNNIQIYTQGWAWGENQTLFPWITSFSKSRRWFRENNWSFMFYVRWLRLSEFSSTSSTRSTQDWVKITENIMEIGRGCWRARERQNEWKFSLLFIYSLCFSQANKKHLSHKAAWRYVNKHSLLEIIYTQRALFLTEKIHHLLTPRQQRTSVKCLTHKCEAKLGFIDNGPQISKQQTRRTNKRAQTWKNQPENSPFSDEV